MNDVPPQPVVTLARPTPALRKSIKVNFKDFGKAVGKAGASGAFGNWGGVASSAVDALAALGLKSGPSEMGWLLVYRGLMRSARQVVEETLQLIPDSKDDSALHTLLLDALSERSVSLTSNFFSHPERAPVVEAAVAVLETWFQNQGIAAPVANACARRLKAYISSALHEEWASSPVEYSKLKSQLDTPFVQASEREFSRSRYVMWLKKQVDEPLFLESFSLRQIFVPLRACYDVRAKIEGVKEPRKGPTHLEEQGEMAVVDLGAELRTWLQQAKRHDAVRLVSGGPGSGKSSFAKMFAAEIASEGSLPVLFIPLHHFDPSGDLLNATTNFLRSQNILTFNPLSWEEGEPRVLLVFDGLDELAMQGKVGEKTAQDFVREVLMKVNQLNQQALRVQVLITGRELVIQSSETFFRHEGQVLKVLPYFITEEVRMRGSYRDPKGLLKVDQRQSWWKKYGLLTGQSFDGLPSELDQNELIEVSSQPLLNYLAALAIQRGLLKFSSDTSLNLIYADLLHAIYERGWSTVQHATLRGLEERDFNRVLEEIALASWHGDGRTTTIREIQTHCELSGTQSLLDRFQGGLVSDRRSGITQLLTAFYFRQSGQDSSGERTFEFTHKSFGEYLTARRLVREIRLIHRRLAERDKDSDEGWDAREALRRWLLLTGASAMDTYLFSFIDGEVQQCAAEAREWQVTLCRLLSFVLRHGLPLERLDPRPSFLKEREYSRNAEESLLSVINACARTAKYTSEIDWPDLNSLGSLVYRLVGQRQYTPSLTLDCLGYLAATNAQLTTQDFWNADLRFCNLQNAHLVGADCRYADFSNADLRGAHLVYGNFMGASFENAKLGGADAEMRAYLVGRSRNPEGSDRLHEETCSLEGADFTSADLEGINFFGLDVRTANFAGATLLGASFEFAFITPEQAEQFSKAGAEIANAVIRPTQRESARFTPRHRAVRSRGFTIASRLEPSE